MIVFLFDFVYFDSLLLLRTGLLLLDIISFSARILVGPAGILHFPIILAITVLFVGISVIKAVVICILPPFNILPALGLQLLGKSHLLLHLGLLFILAEYNFLLIDD